jgi:hypothetical protein
MSPVQWSNPAREAERAFWSGRYPVEGINEAHMCDYCGRMLLYAYPDAD